MSNPVVSTADRHLPPLPVADDGALRVLTLTSHELGWRTYADSIESACAIHPDVAAVHVRIEASRWVRAAGAKVAGRRPPGHLDPHYRRTLAGTAAARAWLRRHLDLRSFDVVHATPQLAALPLLGLRDRPPLVVGLDATLTQGKAQRRDVSEADAARRHAPLVALEHRALDNADRIVAMSRWAADAVVDEIGRDDDIVVIPPSLPAPTEVVPLPRSSDLVRLVFVGNGWERKGGPRLLRWHQDRLVGKAELHVCSGDAPIDPTCRDVVWHGPTPRDRILREILPGADVFVLPTGSDMSPWAIVEAVGAGVPVLSSAIGGIGELVLDGETGLLCDPADEQAYAGALERLVTDDDLRRRMRDAAENRAAQDLDHARLTDRLVEVWREVSR